MSCIHRMFSLSSLGPNSYHPLLSFSVYLCSSLDSRLLEGRASILLITVLLAFSTRIRQLCTEGLPLQRAELP